MHYHKDRIEKAQALMQEKGMLGMMLMTRDDLTYFFGEPRVQPRAILPVEGKPILICFHAEEQEIREALPEVDVEGFHHVGQQMTAVSKTFRELAAERGLKDEKPRVGMQMWFQTPAFLVDLFRTLNPELELVSSDPVMDQLRMVKDPEEFERLRKAQQIAGLGMDRVKELLKPGITGLELAAEASCVMLKAGASGTSTPIHINIGVRSCWIHGKADQTEVREGDLVVVNLTPVYQGYCANLARTYVIGKPDAKQQLLMDAYRDLVEATRLDLTPGNKVGRLDNLGREILNKYDLEDFHVGGISHGIGLRFEETPASTIMPKHRRVKFLEDMALTIGHTILAVPGFGGVRFEDIYRVTPQGGEILYDYPVEFQI